MRQNLTRSLRGALLLVLLTGLTLVVAGQAMAAIPESMEDLARQADAAYRDGDYDRAISLYGDIRDAGYVSGVLWYNLGNAHYKAGDLGEAILMYERASRLLPHDDNVSHNLELARERTVDRVDAPPRLVVWTWLDALRDSLPPRTVALTALGLAVLTGLLVALLVNLSATGPRRLVRSALLLSGVLTVLALSLIGLRIAAESGEPAAIILAQMTEVRTAPDPTAQQAFQLHEGTRVNVIQTVDTWSEIRLADGRQGWLPSGTFETL